MIEHIWIVTQIDDGNEPVVTAFKNETAAKAMESYYLNQGKSIFVDKAPLYNSFMIFDENEFCI